MPVIYKIFSDHRLLATRMSGLITSDEFIEAYRQIYADECLRPDFRELVDLRRVRVFDVNLEGFQQVSDMTAEYHAGAPTKTAFVCDHSTIEIITRLYKTLAEFEGSETVHQFTDIRAALEWLGASDFPVENLEF